MTARGVALCRPPPAINPNCRDSLARIGLTLGSAYWWLCRRRHKHQLRHAHAVEMSREGIPLLVIQRQLGHANLGTTSIYLQGIDTEEIIATVHTKRAPMMSATADLRL